VPCLKEICKCLVVDDDDIDRLTVLAHLRQYPFIQVMGAFGSAVEAAGFLEKNSVEMLLLDIEMPGLSGLELRRRFLEVPVCIFITSFPDFAVDSFDEAALDYILKPFTQERFARAMDRAVNYLEIKDKADKFEFTLGADTIFIKEGHEKIKVKLHDIVYLEALKDYTTLVTGQRKYCVLANLGTLLEEKDFGSFVRIHRSFAVQRHYIQKVDRKNIQVQGMNLPIGKAFRKNIEDLSH
jgi:two-component system, LytTR family, response regulator